MIADMCNCVYSIVVPMCKLNFLWSFEICNGIYLLIAMMRIYERNILTIVMF